MSDIIIVDEEFKAVVEQIKTEGKETDEAVQKLIDVFTRITEEVAVEGSVAENFKLLFRRTFKFERTIYRYLFGSWNCSGRIYRGNRQS